MKLITWNIQWCRGCDGRVDPHRIVQCAKDIADFDVLCLQEVAANFPELEGSQGDNQFEILSALLPDYEAIPGVAVDIAPRQNHKRQVFGNLLFSRWPVLRVLRHTLPWPADALHTGMPRMLIEATIATPRGNLRVMTTHLEYHSSMQRAAQVEAILTLHAQSAARHFVVEEKEGPFRAIAQPVSAILTADFNFRPEDALWERVQQPVALQAPAFRDAWKYLYPDQPHPPTIGIHDCRQWPTPYACDFIFVTEDLLPRVRKVTIDAHTDASDHQPVLIELE